MKFLKFPRYYRVWQRNRDVFLRLWPAELGGFFLEPVIVLLALGYGLGSFVGEIQGLSYAQWVAPGIIASYAMFHSAFETTYGKVSLVRRLYQYASSPIYSLTGNQEKNKTGGKLADDLIAYIQKQMPQTLTLDSNKARARDFYYTIANIHSHARRDQEGLAVYTQLGKLIGVNDDLRGKQAAWHRARGR